MTRALAALLLLIPFTMQARAFAGGESGGASRAASPARLSNSALARAEKLLGELARLDAASSDARSDETIRAARKASEIFLRAQELPESDLRVDLSTAARLYERAFARASARKSGAVNTSSDATASCSEERPGAYRGLCARVSPRDAVALLVVKARKHTEWARASVAEERGESGSPSVALDEMRGERALDMVVARQAITALAALDALSDPPATLSDYEEGKEIGKVSPAEFGARLDAAAQTIKRSLAWLPESPLKSEIDRAWQSYTDALWWWELGERGQVVRVTNNRYASRDFAAMAHVDGVQLGYNAVVNLRHAREYTRRAEASAEAERKRAGFAAGN
ncbi:MAG: hypothetical protein M3268_09300 [Acidobacteriota bacterium]|nr:hypothetical protein [Acidobacteriota bacterium]